LFPNRHTEGTDWWPFAGSARRETQQINDTTDFG